jgi:hypothetical protein
MKKQTVSAREASVDFCLNVWPTLFAGKRSGSQANYSRVTYFVKAVQAGTASEQWIIRILSTYAPDRYNIKVSDAIFEITT